MSLYQDNLRELEKKRIQLSTCQIKLEKQRQENLQKSNEYKKYIQLLQTKLNQYQIQLQRYKEYQQEFKEKIVSLASTNRQNQTQKLIIDKLNSQHNQCQNDLHYMERELKNFKENYYNLKKESNEKFQQLQKQIQQLKEQKQNNLQLIQISEENNINLSNSLHQYKMKLQQAELRNKSIQHHNQTLRQQNINLKAQINQLNENSNNQLEQKLSHINILSQGIKNLQKQICQLNQLNQNQKRQLIHKNNQINSLKQSLKKLEIQKVLLQSSMNQKLGKIKKLQNKCQQLYLKISSNELVINQMIQKKQSYELQKQQSKKQYLRAKIQAIYDIRSVLSEQLNMEIKLRQ